MNVLVAAKLHANQLERHIEPLALMPEIKRIIVVRQSPIPTRLPKIENVNFPDRGTLINFTRMTREVNQVIQRNKIDWVLGFNPIPWGAAAWLGARSLKIPVSLSFIGLDIKKFQQIQFLPIQPLVRRAQLVTVTGEGMRRTLISAGVSPSRIHVLPHAVDTARFAPRDCEKDFDLVCVGQLIERKRMDLVIDAVARLKSEGIRLRTAIVGQGHLKNRLQSQIQRLNLEDSVKLLGYLDHVEKVLARSRVFVLASEWEGVPFAMIEAACSGLIPVVTDVGTISDFIRNDENGKLLPVGDLTALVNALRHLFTDSSHFEKLKKGALALRQPLSLPAASEFWRQRLTMPSQG